MRQEEPFSDVDYLFFVVFAGGVWLHTCQKAAGKSPLPASPPPNGNTDEQNDDEVASEGEARRDSGDGNAGGEGMVEAKPTARSLNDDDAEQGAEPEYRDQGFTRPKVGLQLSFCQLKPPLWDLHDRQVLVLLPFRNSAFAFVRGLFRLVPALHRSTIAYKARFLREYGPEGPQARSLKDSGKPGLQMGLASEALLGQRKDCHLGEFTSLPRISDMRCRVGLGNSGRLFLCC